jgi:hypothetical protein
MEDDDELEPRRTNIGGRYGSPTVTIALPFAKITSTDSELREAVADLAALVARLANAADDERERAAIALAAGELSSQLSATG